MPRPEGLSVWTKMVSSHMPHLTKPQAVVLAMWSYGIALTRSCGRRSVALFLALLLKRKVGSIEQRLREWCYAAQDKQGAKRQELDVSSSFVPLLSWVLSLRAGTSIALALDATSLSDCFVALSISVVYRGCGIPVLWTVLIGRQKTTWRHHWLCMLHQLHPDIPAGWTVLVLADQGLYSFWLFRRIVRLGWHPFLRINQGTKFRPSGQARWYGLNALVSQGGMRGCGRGTVFRSYGRRLPCTLVAWWAEGHDEPWFTLTDLAPEGYDANWYALRAWCEQGFKCIKRGGWQWQHTRMTDPDRAARLWLALAMATLWMVSVGTDLETGPAPDGQDIPDLRDILGLMTQQTQHHCQGLFRLDWLWLLVQLVTAHPLPLPRRLIPEPWPGVPQLWPSPVFHVLQPVYVSI